MRRLTVLREKTMVASISTVELYITCSTVGDESEEVIVGGEQCKKLGELNDGEEKTFMIGEESAKLFAVYKYNLLCNVWDEIKIPEGTQGLRICGKSRFAPFVGNPFNFKEQIIVED